MNIQILRSDPRDAPPCAVCGRQIDTNHPLTFQDMGGAFVHTDCFARWQGTRTKTYWSGPTTAEQIRKVRQAPGVQVITAIRRATNPLSDVLEVDALMNCTEPDGRYNPFTTTFTFTAPTAQASRFKSPYTNVSDTVQELLDGSPFANIISLEGTERKRRR